MDNKSHFFEDGIVDLGAVLQEEDCANLLKQFYKLKPFDNKFFKEQVFLKEGEHDPTKSQVGSGPKPGRNLTEKVDLDFVEKNPEIKKALSEILGEDYRIMQKIFVMGVPEDMMPEWYQKIRKNGYGPLTPFINSKFYDMTYFSGIDYHQDMIDFKNRKGDFVTLYVYLDEVTPDMSPLHIVPKSHEFGAKDLTTISEDITITNDNKITYSNHEGKSKKFDYKMLTGKPGSVYFWSAYTLHGTMPTPSTHKARISLRYLIERGDSTKELPIDEFLKKINGPLILTKSNKDIPEFATASATGSGILR